MSDLPQGPPVFSPGDLSTSGSWQVLVYPADSTYYAPPIPYDPGPPRVRGSVAIPPSVPPVDDYDQHYHLGGPTNLTMFRGAPTQIAGLGTSDPFGPTVGSLTFPAITVLDTPGVGDLTWLQPESSVDICWVDAAHNVVWTWEGYFHTFDWNEDDIGSGLTITCNGALRQMDNYLAKPEYRYQPMPYEVAIYRQFSGHPDSRLSAPPAPADAFPSWWAKTFKRKDYPADQPWLLPEGVKDGDLWTGMLTRETGHFEPTLTGYIQGLLTNMFTEYGQFTLMLGNGRMPYLDHRTRLTAPQDDTLVVDLTWRGVSIHPSVDYSQKISVIFGQGRSSSGDTYSGMEVTADGAETYYDPLAYDPAVHPTTDNPRLNKGIMRKEVNLTFSDGIDALEARKAAEQHRAQFADPGITASLTLKIDPVTYGDPTTSVPRATISAGRSIWVKGLFGRDVLFHITETNLDMELTQTLTLDTQFRDSLTVDQVRKRTRDSLVPFRTLSVAGTFEPKIPDLLFPWSYENGAGVIPYVGAKLFLKLGPGKLAAAGATNPEAVPFPWTEYTTAFPPSKYPQFYIKVPARNHNADYNWANAKWRRGGVYNKGKPVYTFVPYTVLFSAAGSIRMIQFAAYNADGTLKKVPFHVSLWSQSTPSYTSMPEVPPRTFTPVSKTATIAFVGGSRTVTLRHLPRGHGITNGALIHVSTKVRGVTGDHTATSVGSTFVTFNLAAPASATTHNSASVSVALPQRYPPGQHYPFFPQAWEKWKADGTQNNDQFTLPKAPLMQGWGTGYEKAGFWPGSSSEGDTAATGMLVDETPWPYDFRNTGNGIHVMDRISWNLKHPAKVTGWVMVYCDADDLADTFFLGRLWRQDYLQN